MLTLPGVPEDGWVGKMAAVVPGPRRLPAQCLQADPGVGGDVELASSAAVQRRVLPRPGLCVASLTLAPGPRPAPRLRGGADAPWHLGPGHVE